jgi:hypothetical protein
MYTLQNSQLLPQLTFTSQAALLSCPTNHDWSGLQLMDLDYALWDDWCSQESDCPINLWLIMFSRPISSGMTSLERERDRVVRCSAGPGGTWSFVFGPEVNYHAWCFLCLPISGYDNVFVQCAVVLWCKLVSVLNYLMLNLITEYLHS